MVFDSVRCPLPPDIASLASCTSASEREIRCETLFGSNWRELARKTEIDQFFSLLDGEHAINLTAIQWPAVSDDGTVGPVMFRFRYEKFATNWRARSPGGWSFAMPSALDSTGEGEMIFEPGEWDDRLGSLVKRWCKYVYGAFNENTADVEIATVSRLKSSLCV